MNDFMDFNDYQEKAATTAIYPKAIGLAYVALGLSGEAGEVANKIKKVYRDNEGQLTEKRRFEIADELGDCLWYIAMLADELGIKLSYIAGNNIEKLKLRKIEKTLQGDGDKR